MLQSQSAFQVLLPFPCPPPLHPQALRHGVFLPLRSQMAHPCCFSCAFLPRCFGTCCFSMWNSLIQGRPVPLWLPPLGLACFPTPLLSLWAAVGPHSHPSRASLTQQKEDDGGVTRLASAELTRVTGKTGAFFCVFLGPLCCRCQCLISFKFTQTL